MKISIVVCTKGRFNDLKECLLTLKSQIFDACEVVVVDGDGDPVVANYVSQLGFLYVDQVKEGGLMNTPAARNIGIKHCHGSIIAFIDDDALPFPEWLPNLYDCYLKQNPMAVGGPVIPIGNSTRVSFDKYKSALIRSVFKVLLKEDTFEIGRIYPSGLVTENFDFIPEKILLVESIVGTNMSFQRKLFDKVGVFDEFVHTSGVRDETDLCARTVRSGGRIIYCPGVAVYHKFAPKCESKKHLYYIYYTDFYFLFKNRQDFSINRFIIRESLLLMYLLIRSTPKKGNCWKHALRGRIDGYFYGKHAASSQSSQRSD